MRVTITAGNTQTCAGLRRWHVAGYPLLVSGLDARLHTGELRIAAELIEAGALGEELKDFRRKISAAGRYTFEARVGKHDDLVLAVAIGLWAIVGRPKPGIAAFGTDGSTAPTQSLFGFATHKRKLIIQLRRRCDRRRPLSLRSSCRSDRRRGLE